jgi:4-hydroxythreonine-4-phosphate dehydrogenase
MRGAIGIVGAQLHVLPIGRIEEAIWQQGNIDVIDTNNVDYKDLQLGRVSATAGNAAFEAVKRAIELALAGSIDAVVTAPINKEALQLAGHRFPGHTEIFAHYTKTPDYTMMLAEGDLRVVHVSTHVSLLEACRAVTRDRVLKVIELANVACRQLGIDRPRIGVAGLNPHAGDGGLFGDEEQRHIIPAVEAARATGITVEGPLPADTLFAKALGGAFDICVAMYHDQGHIPVKMKGFRFDGASGKWESVSGINVSLGLPIIRTSVDHGTAFDQAGKGTASEMSLLNAIDYAARMSMAKRR